MKQNALTKKRFFGKVEKEHSLKESLALLSDCVYALCDFVIPQVTLSFSFFDVIPVS